MTKQLKQDVIATAARIKSADNPGNAILLVGHQPLLGWLSHAFAGEAHPIANSEMLCLDLTKPSSGLRWAVSPSDPEAVVELKEKIKSKMDVAKLLASFLGAGLSFLLSTMANKDVDLILGSNMWAFAVGSVFLLVALGFFLWTMCSYDTLLMPHRMWAETPRGRSERPAWVVARPPSLVHWILYQNMVRIWQWQFLPATGLMLAGLSMLFSAVFGARLLETVVADCINLFLIVLVVVVLVLKTWRHFGEVVSACKCPGISSKIRHLCAPWLGSED